MDAGAACSAYQNKNFRRLDCKRIEVDEISSFVYQKRGTCLLQKKRREKQGMSLLGRLSTLIPILLLPGSLEPDL